jgi:hypothetical protein
MSALNRFLKDLNQNRSLQAGIQAVEKNRNFLSVGCGFRRNLKAKLNLCLNFLFSRPSGANAPREPGSRNAGVSGSRLATSWRPG